MPCPILSSASIKMYISAAHLRNSKLLRAGEFKLLLIKPTTDAAIRFLSEHLKSIFLVVFCILHSYGIALNFPIKAGSGKTMHDPINNRQTPSWLHAHIYMHIHMPKHIYAPPTPTITSINCCFLYFQKMQYNTLWSVC